MSETRQPRVRGIIDKHFEIANRFPYDEDNNGGSDDEFFDIIIEEFKK